MINWAQEREMAREIELKARISKPGETRNKLFNLATLNGTFEKEDEYWKRTDGGIAGHTDSGGLQYGVRIRKEKFTSSSGVVKETSYVTWKQKKIRNGTEFNDENEFEVSSASVFELFLRHLGYEPEISKRKKGTAFSWGNITAEVTKVDKLGWFLELEIIMPDRDRKREISSGEILLQALDKLGIKRKAVECRSYSQMLAEL